MHIANVFFGVKIAFYQLIIKHDLFVVYSDLGTPLKYSIVMNNLFSHCCICIIIRKTFYNIQLSYLIGSIDNVHFK